MSDPAIKLFGKTIQLLNHHHHHHPLAKPNQEQQQQHDCSKETLHKERSRTQTDNTSAAEELIDPSTSSGINDDPKTPTTDKETSSKSTPKKENPGADSNSNSDEKPQKPDKILPCPRCDSMDTKFCYYNNYNVSQPRHFCKTCQRYWTVGGTLRNTPVGSGRRKNKSPASVSDYRHLIVSESLQKTHGNVLSFGSDVPLCESMNSALNFSDKSLKSEDDHSVFCSSSASNSAEKGPSNKNFQGYPIQIPCFPAPPWPYPWSSAQYQPPLVPPTSLGPSGFPVSFYPTPQYWGCTVQPPPWSIPWVAPPNDQIAPTSPLGKHSRDGSLLSPPSNSGNEEFSRDNDSENGVLIPKTLRINDPNEAAKSSLMSTLQVLKDEKGSHSANGGNLYKAFKSKGDEKSVVADSSLVNLQSNPAALSRSLNFRETS